MRKFSYFTPRYINGIQYRQGNRIHLNNKRGIYTVTKTHVWGFPEYIEITTNIWGHDENYKKHNRITHVSNVGPHVGLANSKKLKNTCPCCGTVKV